MAQAKDKAAGIRAAVDAGERARAEVRPRASCARGLGGAGRPGGWAVGVGCVSGRRWGRRRKRESSGRATDLLTSGRACPSRRADIRGEHLSKAIALFRLGFLVALTVQAPLAAGSAGRGGRGGGRGQAVEDLNRRLRRVLRLEARARQLERSKGRPA